MTHRNRPNQEATNIEKFMYKWGACLMHSILWAIGLSITLNIYDVLSIFTSPKYYQGIQLITVFVVFVLDLAISFFSTACERKIQAVRISIFKIIALFVTIIAFTLIALGVYLMSECSNTQNLAALALIGASAAIKGLEIWIQHNLDKYAQEIKDGSGDYESSFDEEKEK